jgi:diketogulonate reductase-like aldo/keto reductase
MQNLWAAGGHNVQTNQVLYNLLRRGIEWDLLPSLRERGIPVMAYSPLEQGKLVKHPELVDFATRVGITPAQAALGWILANDDIIAIPKTGSRQRLREIVAALDHPLEACQLEELDRLFPPPAGAQPLEMI